MLFKSVKNIASFIAGDETIIKELLHPKNEAVDINYSLAHAVLEPNTRSQRHQLKTSSELYFVLSGQGKAYIGDEEQILKTGDLALVPAGKEQYVVNTGTEKLVFLCIVSPPWSAADEWILE